jgi:hypothetical protein
MGDAGKEFIVAAGSNMVSGAMFNCFDVARVRLQIQDGLGQSGTYRGLPQTLAKIVREEGALGPWRPGLGAAVFRELFYGGFQFGAYGPIKGALGKVAGSGNSSDGGSMLQKLLASCCSGASASLLGCPTDVVKTRLQCESGRKDASGVFTTGLYKGKKPQYRHSADAMVKIFQREGVGGFYSGVVPTVIRAVFLTAGLLVSYDSFKQEAKARGWASEGLALHVAGGMISGLCAATTAAPWDLIKTRIQNDAKGEYKGVLDCMAKTIRHEGPLALYKGWLAMYLRLGPAVVVQVPMIEYARQLVGLSYFGVIDE